MSRKRFYNHQLLQFSLNSLFTSNDRCFDGVYFQVVQSQTSAVTCSTTAVRSNFKYGYHVFGQQEATFQEVEYQGDMVLIARLFLKKRESDFDDFVMPDQAAQEPSLYDDETCVAWAALPLVYCEESKPLLFNEILVTL